MAQQAKQQQTKQTKAANTSAGKMKPSYKHVPHSQKPKEVVDKRNARERRRVQAVNQAFYKLRRCVPIENRNKRVSKVKTLQRAIDYIRKLESILAQDDEQASSTTPAIMGQPQQQQQIVVSTTTNRTLSTMQATGQSKRQQAKISNINTRAPSANCDQNRPQQQLDDHQRPQIIKQKRGRKPVSKLAPVEEIAIQHHHHHQHHNVDQMIMPPPPPNNCHHQLDGSQSVATSSSTLYSEHEAVAVANTNPVEPYYPMNNCQASTATLYEQHQPLEPQRTLRQPSAYNLNYYTTAASASEHHHHQQQQNVHSLEYVDAVNYSSSTSEQPNFDMLTAYSSAPATSSYSSSFITQAAGGYYGQQMMMYDYEPAMATSASTGSWPKTSVQQRVQQNDHSAAATSGLSDKNLDLTATSNDNNSRLLASLSSSQRVSGERALADRVEAAVVADSTTSSTTSGSLSFALLQASPCSTSSPASSASSSSSASSLCASSSKPSGAVSVQATKANNSPTTVVCRIGTTAVPNNQQQQQQPPQQVNNYLTYSSKAEPRVAHLSAVARGNNDTSATGTTTIYKQQPYEERKNSSNATSSSTASVAAVVTSVGTGSANHELQLNKPPANHQVVVRHLLNGNQSNYDGLNSANNLHEQQQQPHYHNHNQHNQQFALNNQLLHHHHQHHQEQQQQQQQNQNPNMNHHHHNHHHQSHLSDSTVEQQHHYTGTANNLMPPTLVQHHSIQPNYTSLPL